MTKFSGFFSSSSRNSRTSLNGVPSGNAPDGSIDVNPLSKSRHSPTPSKFSNANPSGSIIEWQLAQTGFARWADIRSRIVLGRSLLTSCSFNFGTFGGGLGGGTPRIFSKIHLPRRTGDVRLGCDVAISIDA